MEVDYLPLGMAAFVTSRVAVADKVVEAPRVGQRPREGARHIYKHSRTHWGHIRKNLFFHFFLGFPPDFFMLVRVRVSIWSQKLTKIRVGSATFQNFQRRRTKMKIARAVELRSSKFLVI